MDEEQQEALPISVPTPEMLPEVDAQLLDAAAAPVTAAAEVPALPKKRGRKPGSATTKAANQDGATTAKLKPSVASGGPSRPGHTVFPVSKVAKIIKADKDIPLVQKEATFLMSVATEHFIRRLSDAAYTKARMENSKTIRYKDLASACVSDEGDAPGDFFFLEEVISKATHSQFAAGK